MRILNVRISDELHPRLRAAAGEESVASFVREAIAEKLGRSEMADRLERLEARVAELERRLKSSDHHGG